MVDKIAFTLIDADTPKTVAKKYSLDAGALKKETSAHLSKGRASRQVVADLTEFGERVETLNTSQVLIYGVTVSGADANIVTSRQLENSPSDLNAIARTKTHFEWSDGPAIFMIDVDHTEGRETFTGEDLVAAVRQAVPELKNASILHHLSSSSNISDLEGRTLTAERGHRLYIAISNGNDISRFAKQLETRLWAEGHGYIVISKSGAILERNLIDMSVYQPNRLDFAAGAALGPGLSQDRGRPQLYPALNGAEGHFDTQAQIPDADSTLERKAQNAKNKARHIAQPDAALKREEWKRARAIDVAARTVSFDVESDVVLDKALDQGILCGSFILQVRPRGAQGYQRITVSEILSNTKKYHRATCRDPLDPNYRDGAPVGTLYLRGAKHLYSYAHGGATYTLEEPLQNIELLRGETHLATDQLLSLMRASGHFFDQGDVMVTIADGRPHALLPSALSYFVAKQAQFTKASRNGESQQKIDPPIDVLKQLSEMGKMRRLPALLGTCRLPIINPDGSVLQYPGYDPESQIYGDFDEDAFEPIPDAPTIGNCEEALNILLEPFDEVQFVDAESSTALLCALLTALCRSCIDKSPAFVADACSPGAGKSMLCEAIGALAIGTSPGTMAPLNDGHEDEIRKRMMSALLPPAESIINIDNQNGRVDSRVLSQLLTSISMTDRLLGLNKLASEIPNRALILMSGNNIEFSEELSRRILRMTFKVPVNDVFERKFKRDVVPTVLKDREKLITAGQTLISAAMKSHVQSDAATVPSYREWDRMVRQTILWINVNLGKTYVDPLEIMRRSMKNSPERHDIYSLLESFSDVFGDQTFTAADILTCGSSVMEAHVKGLTGRSGLASPKSVGMHLSRLRGRVIGDLVLRHHTSNNTAHYQVERYAAVNVATGGAVTGPDDPRIS